ncbi:MAG: EAL domain-containing protein [Firmicutes bacterium]|nr:EAL domain-containing protein [Bacillota bacterium]
MVTLLILMVFVGLLMGICFPFLIQRFVVIEINFNFRLACVLAGLTVGMFNFWLVKKTLSNLHKQLVTQARYDSLTNLLNRPFLKEKVNEAIETAEQKGKALAILFIDLDHFKSVNDTMGHAVGDKVLQGVAQFLQTCVRGEEIVGRMGGDEFIIFLPEIMDTEFVKAVSRKILCITKQPWHTGENKVFLSVSIGIALYPNDGKDTETLLSKADIALYSAKKNGKDCYKFYNNDMETVPTNRVLIKNNLKEALKNNELKVYYQPIISVSSKSIVGMEALVRWQHPKYGLLSPMDFIPVAEELGLILDIGEMVLRKACHQIKTLEEKGFKSIYIAVNFSAKQLQQPDLAQLVFKVINESGLEPKHLKVEITESIPILKDANVVNTLQALRNIGVEVSLDDFGTGSSSLSYLKYFPIDNIKIDKSFIRNAHLVPHNKAIIKALIALAKQLELTITAEGVETESEFNLLKIMECDEVQGYLFSKPEPIHKLYKLLTKRE